MPDWWNVNPDVNGKRAERDAVVAAFANANGVGWLRAECPICIADGSKDLKRSLGLNTATGGYNCYKCGARGRLRDEHIQQLGTLVDLEIDDVELDVTRFEDEKFGEPAPGFVRVFEEPGLSNPEFDLVRHYVCSPSAVNINGQRCRGIPAQRAFEMQMGTGTGKCWNRLVTPILNPTNPNGPWLGWHGRDFTGESLVPHLYSKGLDRSKTMWNMEALRIETDFPLFVCEGILDAQTAWPHGVACLGKPIKEHVDFLRKVKRPIAVCLDGDAWREGEALTMKLKLFGKKAVNVRLPPKTDPGDLEQTTLFAQALALF
jgi:hypothetical protein